MGSSYSVRGAMAAVGDACGLGGKCIEVDWSVDEGGSGERRDAVLLSSCMG